MLELFIYLWSAFAVFLVFGELELKPTTKPAKVALSLCWPLVPLAYIADKVIDWYQARK